MPISQPLPRYTPITAIFLIVAVVGSIFVFQNGWYFLLKMIADSSVASFTADNTLTIMSLVLTAVSLAWLILIWQYLRIRQLTNDQTQAVKLWRHYFGFEPMRLRSFLGALAVLLVSIALSSWVVVQLSDWLKPAPSMDAAQLVDQSTPMWLFALLVLICAPVYEELICRGLFWRLGEDMFSPFFTHPQSIQIAISLLSSGIFAILHFQYNYIDLIIMVAISLALCYARIRTQSVFAPMLLHSVNNSLVLLLMIFT
ncbi:CPBP family intramembrane glutamic endopeptidase [Moraxella canis]|uniref:CPBP family intramembrane glutamic endopeptidase n=1 Tax=Moraxella canis TaxID=90239 RepID=A0ABZ0WX13_9GAMM|nr:CPBP family intramembrane glutamic endopeptidase [Moraxella canis]WQE03786.1 CPBP family intramembrane glutamic endopeptidase [Moraxella canis]